MKLSRGASDWQQLVSLCCVIDLQQRENAASRNRLRSEAAVHDVIYGHLDWKWGSETPTDPPPLQTAHTCTWWHTWTYTHTHACIQCDCSAAVERWGGRHCLSAASDFMISALCEEDAAVTVNLPPDLTANDANLKQWPDSRCRQTSVPPECWWWCGLEGCSWIKYNLLYKLFVLSTFVQCYYLCQAGGSQFVCGVAGFLKC